MKHRFLILVFLGILFPYVSFSQDRVHYVKTETMMARIRTQIVKKNSDEHSLNYEILIYNNSDKKRYEGNCNLYSFENAEIIYIDNFCFPYYVYEPGFYVMTIDERKTDLEANVYYLDPLDIDNINRANYTVYHESTGFIWTEKKIEISDDKYEYHVYSPTHTIFKGIDTSLYISYMDARFVYKDGKIVKRSNYYGYEGACIHIMNYDFHEIVYTLDGKKIKDFGEMASVGLCYSCCESLDKQKVGYYTIDTDNDRFILYDSKGNVIKKMKSGTFHFFEELAEHLPSNSTSLLHNKKNDLNKLYNRTDVYSEIQRETLDDYLTGKIYEANLNFQFKKYSQAINDYSEILNVQRSREGGNQRFNRGMCYYYLGKYKKALEDFTTCPEYYDLTKENAEKLNGLIDEISSIIQEKQERREAFWMAFAQALANTSQQYTTQSNTMSYNPYRTASYYNTHTHNIARYSIYNILVL